mgnify:CR=1 FL=1
MRYRELNLIVLLSAAAVGCAGTLDENADYSSSAAPVRAGGAGSGGRKSEPVGWTDGGSAGGAAQASNWRDAGAVGTEPEVTEREEDAGTPSTSMASASPVTRNWAGAGGNASGSSSGSSNAAGSGGKAGSPAAAGSGGAAAAAACDFKGLMAQKCAGGGCHGGPGASTGLDLTTAMLGQRVEGRHGSGACTDKLLVDTEDPAQSKLYLKISGSSCGVRMPLGGSLTEAEQACVLSWIEGL